MSILEKQKYLRLRAKQLSGVEKYLIQFTPMFRTAVFFDNVTNIEEKNHFNR